MPDKPISIKVVAPSSGYRVHGSFNRFDISQLDDELIFSFGLVDGNTDLQVHRIGMYLQDVKRIWSSFESYITGLDSISTARVKPWTFPNLGTGHPVYSANFISMSHSGSMAELVFSSFATHSALTVPNKGAKDRTVVPDGIAILRSSIGLQKKLLLDASKHITRT